MCLGRQHSKCAPVSRSILPEYFHNFINNEIPPINQRTVAKFNRWLRFSRVPWLTSQSIKRQQFDKNKSLHFKKLQSKAFKVSIQKSSARSNTKILKSTYREMKSFNGKFTVQFKLIHWKFTLKIAQNSLFFQTSSSSLEDNLSLIHFLDINFVIELIDSTVFSRFFLLLESTGIKLHLIHMIGRD